MPVEVVWQLVLVKSAYKAYKICHFVGLRKREKKKSHCYSLRFLRKAPTKKSAQGKKPMEKKQMLVEESILITAIIFILVVKVKTSR